MRSIAPIALFALLTGCSKDFEGPPAFEGSSEKLKETEIVPTLDMPITSGKSAIWCASFPAMWKALEDLAEGPIAFRETSDLCNRLNAQPDPRSQVPSGCIYSVAGWTDQGMVAKIRQDVRERFPQKPAPTFPELAPNSVLAYCYLDVSLSFPIPYDQNPRPIRFTTGSGSKVNVRSFGLLSENHASQDKLRNQPVVLFRKGGPEDDENFEFAVDLCSNSSPSQIVVARIRRQPTLAAAFAHVRTGIASMPELVQAEAKNNGFLAGYNLCRVTADLLVPELRWSISHRFKQLEGRTFSNLALRDHAMDLAQQDITFRLDRTGARLASTATGAEVSAMPAHLAFDRPFVIYMQKRGAELPYFIMWVDNPELLCLWDGDVRSRGQ